MKIDFSKMKQSNGYLQGDIDCVDDTIKDLPIAYKKRLSRNFYAITVDQITQKIKGNSFFVSKKIDGHLQLIIFNGQDIWMMGRRGIVRAELPCLKVVKEILQKKEITSFIAGSELYVQGSKNRSRVYDVIAALADEKRIDSLGLAVFDILEHNGKSLQYSSYKDVYALLRDIFPATGNVHVIETQTAKTNKEIDNLSAKWIGEEGNEGLVIRTETPFMYKVKPKYTFDVVVIGYVEGINEHKGKVKSMLFACMREPNVYQIIGKVGNNLSEDDRLKFFEMLSQKHIASSYIESDNDGVAFHMVSPELIIEVGGNDVMTENTYGNPLYNAVIKHDEAGYSPYTTIAGVRILYPVYERIREDKTNTPDDINYKQFIEFLDYEEISCTPVTLSASEILDREVYVKGSDDKQMIQKFVLFKTNKEKTDKRYPAYVMYYTNFSPNRKDPLQTEVRISNDYSQIVAITDNFKKENIKKGWVKL